MIERDPAPQTISLDPAAIRPVFDLTDREADVTCLLAEGVDLASISRRLRISRGTVRSYLKNVFEKTGVTRQAELVALLSRAEALSRAARPRHPVPVPVSPSSNTPRTDLRSIADHPAIV